MNRQRKISLLVVLFVATVMMLPTIAGAATSTRTMPASSVEPGTEFTVNVSVADYGALGSVVETIPDGFSYVSSSLLDSQVGEDNYTLTFNLLGESSFEYTVTASDTEGTYTFSGIIKDEDLVEFAIPDSSIDVAAAAVVSASAERTLPASVEPGATVVVSITAADYGTIGSVVETIPAGFIYVSSTLDAAQVEEDGNTVSFSLMGESSFDYTVTASDTEDTYTFSGILKDEDLVEFAIADSSIAVTSEPATPASVERTLPASVELGATVVVRITAADYGSIGSVVETIPAGFTYVGSTLDTPQVIVAGNLATFNLLGESSFDYTVTASDTDGTYTFSGVFKDEDLVKSVIPDSSIDVVVPPEDIPLDAGWNFISTPHELADPNVSSVLEGVAYDAVTYYDAQTRLWDDVSTFEPLKGYWINVSATDQVILEDSLAPAAIIGGTEQLKLQLYEGWNAIGSMHSVAYDAEFVLQSIDDHLIKIVGPWNDGEYELTGYNGYSGPIANGVGTDIFEMSPYSGYWVFVDEDDLMG